MLQTFETAADPAIGPPRVKAVRALMAAAGIDALFVPRSDEHQGEYVAPCAERLQWLTGFSGSAGFAIVTANAAALATDGRYTIQAEAQVHTATFDIIDSTGPAWIAWLAARLAGGGTLGYDPRLHTAAAVGALKVDASKQGFTLKPLGSNLIDRAWGKARPAPPLGKVSLQPLHLAGVAAETKLANVKALLKAEHQHAVVLTQPDSIAWLFNIRGTDITHNPVVLAFAIVHAKAKPELFIEPAKLAPEIRKHLALLAKLAPPKDLDARLKGLKADKGRKVRVDTMTASAWIVGALGGAAENGGDPCILPKACKTASELDGARAAHVRDGAAVCRFLAWLDRTASSNSLDEIAVVEKLEACRAATGALKDLSFATIAGSGPNGALPHYRVSTTTNRRLHQGELIVIDSGGQYQDGTTDITRTVAIGIPSAEMKQRFTQVLKGHIALAVARFPAGTRGIQLDTLARNTLWQAGLDFDHGTGHGVGSFLSVHEGPQSISKRGMAVLEPGMIVSNEPGFYKPGAFGIRIENLEIVSKPAAIAGGERPMLGFECLTLAPIDRRCIDVNLLTRPELDWLNAYHQRVARELLPALAPDEREWMSDATKTLG